MSDIPGTSPEISIELPKIPNPHIEDTNYTQNDSGAQPIENEKNESLIDFAFFMRNMNEGYKQNIRKYIADDGSFLNEDAEQKAVSGWDTWQNTTTLPEISSDNLEDSITAIEKKLHDIKNNVTDDNGNQQFLSFADRERLKKYFLFKYPQQSQTITTTFENLDHDINLVSGGIAVGLSQDQELRNESDSQIYRRKEILQWPEDLIELTAQNLNPESSHNKIFNPTETAEEIVNLYKSLCQATHTSLEIKTIVGSSTINSINDLEIYGNPLALKRVFKNILRYPQTYAEKHANRKTQVIIDFSRPSKQQVLIQFSDNAGGFINDDKLLVDVRNPITINNKEITKQKAFNRKERGTNSVGKGFGLDMVWDVIVNQNNGMVAIDNIKGKDPFGEDTITGARFNIILPVPASIPELQKA